jgi:hypothetical protein
MEKNNLDPGLIQSEIQTSVSFTAFMTAVTIFFVGLLITQFKDLDSSIRIPILFLIISTFGFLYATLIYSNASGKVARLGKVNVDKDMILANSLAEYMGLYFLVLAIPLVINVAASDVFLRVATLIVVLGGLTIYHASGFSIMGRNFPKLHILFLIIILLLGIFMFVMQAFSNLLTITSIITILLMVSLTFFAKKEY